MQVEDHREALEDIPVPQWAEHQGDGKRWLLLPSPPYLAPGTPCTPPTPPRQSGWNLGQRDHLLFPSPAAAQGRMGAFSGGRKPGAAAFAGKQPHRQDCAFL